MLKLNYGDKRPVYEQIKGQIKELIIAGVLKEEEKIPSVRELAVELTINPNTIQKAYRELESEGYIYSVRSKGSFVSVKNEVSRKSDIYKIMHEFKDVTAKLKFLGAEEQDLLEIVREEYKNDRS